MNNEIRAQDTPEQEKLRLEIKELRRIMYIPWLSVALTIVTLLVGWIQFNKQQAQEKERFDKTLTAQFEKQKQDIETQLARDANTQRYEYQKYFLEKRTADYVEAVQTAAAIAEWPADRKKLTSKFKQLHLGTMQLYENMMVLSSMSEFLTRLDDAEQEQREGKSKAKRNDLKNYVKVITDACKDSLHSNVGLPQPSPSVQ